MASNIEVEKRVLLFPSERDRMLERMHDIGDVKEVRRVMIDYSGPDRERTMMLRIDNGIQRLVAKTGSLSDEVRNESSINIANSTPLTDTLKFLAYIGYSNAHLSLRHMFIVEAGELEYSLRDVESFRTGERVATLFEMEALGVVKGEESAASHHISKAITYCGLTALNRQEFEQWVDETHAHVDGMFTYTESSAEQLTQTLTTRGYLAA